MRTRASLYIFMLAFAAVNSAQAADLKPEDKAELDSNLAMIKSATSDLGDGGEMRKILDGFRANAAKGLEEKRTSQALHDAALKDLDAYNDFVKAWVKLLETHNSVLQTEPRSYLPAVDVCITEFGKTWQDDRKKQLRERSAYVGSKDYKGEFGTDIRAVQSSFERAHSFLRAFRGRCSTLVSLGSAEAMKRFLSPEERAKLATRTLGDQKCDELVERYKNLNRDKDGKPTWKHADCKRDIYNDDGSDKRIKFEPGSGRIAQPTLPAAAQRDPAATTAPKDAGAPAGTVDPAKAAPNALERDKVGRPFEQRAPLPAR